MLLPVKDFILNKVFETTFQTPYEVGNAEEEVTRQIQLNRANYGRN